MSQKISTYVPTRVANPILLLKSYGATTASNNQQRFIFSGSKKVDLGGLLSAMVRC